MKCVQLILYHQAVFSPDDDFTLDYVYVENCALAHLLLEDKMRSNIKLVAGEVFCISNGKPMIRYFVVSLCCALSAI